jgi:hypothetical protein
MVTWGWTGREFKRPTEKGSSVRPLATMTDDFSRIAPVYRSLHGQCDFVGTAFFVDGRHLLTARDVVERESHGKW